MLAIDLHIHSINSGHAFGTIYDIAREAARKHMKMVAITDHGPAMEGTSTAISIWMGNRAPKEIEGVRVLWGCEANILNPDGELDISADLQKRLDVVIAGLHLFCGYQDQGVEGNTLTFQRALQTQDVDIVAHLSNPQFPYDLEKVLLTALEKGVLPELNVATLRRKADCAAADKRIVEIVRHHGGKVIVNSDAHFLHEIGDDAILREYWAYLGLSEELVINNYPEELLQRLKIGEIRDSHKLP